MNLVDSAGTVQLFGMCAHVIEKPIDNNIGREIVFGRCADGPSYTIEELVPYLRQHGFGRKTISDVEKYKFV